MERKRTYKSKSGAEYELVQTKAPTKAKKTKTAKASRPTKSKKQTTGEKLAGLSKAQYEKYTDAYERGFDMAESLLIALKPATRKKPAAKKSTAQKTKARKASVKRARKSTAKRKKTPATKKKAKQQLSMF